MDIEMGYFYMENPNSKEIFINATGFQCLENIQDHSVDLSLDTYGVQNCAPGHWFGPGERDIFLIHFICSGTGVYETGGRTYHLSQGDFFVIFPDTQVRYEADRKTPWDYIWVGFQGIKAMQYLSYAGIDREHLIGRYANSSFILSCVQQMMLARAVSPYNEMKRTAALLQIFAAITEEYYISHPDKTTDAYSHQIYLNRALSYIDDNLATPIKVSDIARYVGIDRSYLSVIFKHSLGLSPQEYLVQYRMDQACLMLQDPNQKIGNIARAVGYSDSLAFSKIFRKYKGESPSSYREKLD